MRVYKSVLVYHFLFSGYDWDIKLGSVHIQQRETKVQQVQKIPLFSKWVRLVLYFNRCFSQSPKQLAQTQKKLGEKSLGRRAEQIQFDQRIPLHTTPFAGTPCCYPIAHSTIALLQKDWTFPWNTPVCLTRLWKRLQTVGFGQTVESTCYSTTYSYSALSLDKRGSRKTKPVND